jgi:hypothetical protein
VAILAGNVEAFEILLSCGAEVNSISGSQKITPLMTACSVGSDFVIPLLERGADPGMRDARGEKKIVNFCLIRDRLVVDTLSILALDIQDEEGLDKTECTAHPSRYTRRCGIALRVFRNARLVGPRWRFWWF